MYKKALFVQNYFHEYNAFQVHYNLSVRFGCNQAHGQAPSWRNATVRICHNAYNGRPCVHSNGRTGGSACAWNHSNFHAFDCALFHLLFVTKKHANEISFVWSSSNCNQPKGHKL